MKSEIQEYNNRQIKIIENKIQNFIFNNIYIDWLIADLEALIRCLKNVSDKWFKKFDNLIWEIEIIYACALDENRKNFNSEEVFQIKEIIFKMKDLINNYKKESFIE